MKKIYFTLLAVLSLVFSSTGAIAQNRPLACQSDANGGLDWENGRWVARRFLEEKFVLVQSEKDLTKESVAKALGNGIPDKISCSPVYGAKVSCADEFGGYLLFDPATLKGGMSRIWGATFEDNTNKDSLAVTAFSCTPF